VARQGIRVERRLPRPIDTRMIHDLEKQLNPAIPGKVEATYQRIDPDRRYGTAERSPNTRAVPMLRPRRQHHRWPTSWSTAAALRRPGAVTSMNR